MAQSYQEEISVAIRASAAGFSAEMQAAANSAKSATSEIRSAFGGLSTTFAANVQSANAFSASVAKMMSQTRQAAAEAKIFGDQMAKAMSESAIAASAAASRSAISQAVSFGSAVKDAMATAKEGAREASEAMKSSLEGVALSVEKVTRGFAMVAGVLAGGKIFSETVSAASTMAKEASGLGRALGVTAQEAQILNVAMHSVFLTSDDYLGAVQAITRQINNQNNEFDRLGVKYKDASGNLLSYTTIIQNAIGVLNTYKAGVDRNAAAQALFNRGWQDVVRLGKLTHEVMDEAKEKVRAFNVELDSEKQEQARKYRKAMNEVSESFDLIAVSIGQKLLPALGAGAEKFASFNEKLAGSIRNSLAVLQTSFHFAVAGWRSAVEVWDSILDKMAAKIRAIGRSVSDAIRLDFAKAWEDLSSDTAEQAALNAAAVSRLGEIWDNYGKKAAEAFGVQKKAAAAALENANIGNKTFRPPPPSASDSSGAMLAYQKAQAEAAYRIVKDGLDRELSALRQTNDDKLVSIGDFYRQQADIERKEVDARIATLTKERNLVASAKPKDEADRLNKMAELVRLNSEITILERQRSDIGIKAAHDQATAIQAYKDNLESLQAKLEQMTGQEILGKQREIELQYRDTIARMMAEGDTAGVELVHRLINTEISRSAFEDLKRQYDDAVSEMTRKTQFYNTEAKAGLITQEQAIREINDLHAETQARIEKLLPAMEQYARTVGDPKMKSEVAKVRDEFALMNVKVDETAKQINQGITNSFATMLTDFATHSKSAKSAFSDFAKSVVMDIDRIIAKKMAEQLFGSMFGGGEGGGIGGFFSGLFNGAQFAQGGYTFGDKPIIVGEHGPEMFMPKSAGTITPTGQLMGAVNLHMNVQARDAESFRYSMPQIGAKMAVMMNSARTRNATVYG